MMEANGATQRNLLLTPSLLCAIVLLFATTRTGQSQEMSLKDGTSTFLVAKYPNETTNIFAGEAGNITYTILYVDAEGDFTITLVPQEGVAYATLTFERLHGVSRDLNGMNVTMEVHAIGRKLGILEFDMVAIDESTGLAYRVGTDYVKVKRVRNPIGLIVRYCVTGALIATIWLIGITTDIMIIIRILKRPYGVCIGMICQFVIMPFAAWSLAKIFKIDGAASVGLILDGSCPGGTNSNLLSVLLDVDYVLSITMTFVSTILALGMMPLNLLIYASGFITAGEKIETPFAEIFLQLIILVVPLSIGIFIGYKWPKAKDFAEKYIKPVSALVVVVLICTDLPFNLFIFDSPWEYYAAAIIFPFIGGLSGFLLSKVARLTTRRSLTVALETGVQNALLAITVLFFLYPQPEADLATRLPYLIVIFTTMEGLILAVVYTLLKQFYWHGVPYDDEEEDVKEDTTELKEGGKCTTNNNDTTAGKQGSSNGVPTVSSDVSEQEKGSKSSGTGQLNEAYEPEI